MTIYNKQRSYRRIYEQYYGPIPKDADGRTYDIHHIDGNHDNNDPANLQAISLAEHYDIHYSQGDWAACLLMSARMKISPEEKSRIARLNAERRAANGTLGFQNPEIRKKATAASIETIRSLIQAGMHPLQSGMHPLHSLEAKEKSRLLNLKRVANGTHHFLGGEIQRKTAKERLENGTHHFLDSEWKKQNAKTQLQMGKHPSQKSWLCPHCNKSGRGAGPYARHHGDNCKSLKCDK